MVNIAVSEALAHWLEETAKRENRSVEEVMTSMAKQYHSETTSQEGADNAFDAIFGIYDDDVTDMSTTVRKTLEKYYKEKYGSPD